MPSPSGVRSSSSLRDFRGLALRLLPRACTIRPRVADLVFFYGTLMAGFDRRRRAGIDDKLTYIGRGSIQGALFDLGLYPAAVPAPDGHVWGEVYEMAEPATVLAALDEIEGYRHDDPDRSLYRRAAGATSSLPDGSHARGVGLLLQRASRARAAHRVGRLSRTHEESR